MPETLLLDTHCWLWEQFGNTEKFSRQGRRLIDRATQSGDLRVSVISIWEGTGSTVHDEQSGLVWLLRLGTVKPVPGGHISRSTGRIGKGQAALSTTSSRA